MPFVQLVFFYVLFPLFLSVILALFVAIISCLCL